MRTSSKACRTQDCTLFAREGKFENFKPETLPTRYSTMYDPSTCPKTDLQTDISVDSQVLVCFFISKKLIDCKIAFNTSTVCMSRSYGTKLSRTLVLATPAFFTCNCFQHLTFGQDLSVPSKKPPIDTSVLARVTTRTTHHPFHSAAFRCLFQGVPLHLLAALDTMAWKIQATHTM